VHPETAITSSRVHENHERAKGGASRPGTGGHGLTRTIHTTRRGAEFERGTIHGEDTTGRRRLAGSFHRSERAGRAREMRVFLEHGSPRPEKYARVDKADAKLCGPGGAWLDGKEIPYRKRDHAKYDRSKCA